MTKSRQFENMPYVYKHQTELLKLFDTDDLISYVKLKVCPTISCLILSTYFITNLFLD